MWLEPWQGSVGGFKETVTEGSEIDAPWSQFGNFTQLEKSRDAAARSTGTQYFFTAAFVLCAIIASSNFLSVSRYLPIGLTSGKLYRKLNNSRAGCGNW